MANSKTRAYFDKETEVVIWEINGFVSFEDFTKTGDQTHKLREEHGVEKQINDIESMKVLSKNIQKWINDVFFPKAQKTGLKHFAFVVPVNTFGKISMSSVNEDASKKYGMDIQYFDSREKAVEWINTKG